MAESLHTMHGGNLDRIADFTHLFDVAGGMAHRMFGPAAQTLDPRQQIHRRCGNRFIIIGVLNQ